MARVYYRKVAREVARELLEVPWVTQVYLRGGLLHSCEPGLSDIDMTVKVERDFYSNPEGLLKLKKKVAQLRRRFVLLGEILVLGNHSQEVISRVNLPFVLTCQNHLPIAPTGSLPLELQSSPNEFQRVSTAVALFQHFSRYRAFYSYKTSYSSLVNKHLKKIMRVLPTLVVKEEDPTLIPARVLLQLEKHSTKVSFECFRPLEIFLVPNPQSRLHPKPFGQGMGFFIEIGEDSRFYVLPAETELPTLAKFLKEQFNKMSVTVTTQPLFDAYLRGLGMTSSVLHARLLADLENSQVDSLDSSLILQMAVERLLLLHGTLLNTGERSALRLKYEFIHCCLILAGRTLSNSLSFLISNAEKKLPDTVLFLTKNLLPQMGGKGTENYWSNFTKMYLECEDLLVIGSPANDREKKN